MEHSVVLLRESGRPWPMQFVWIGDFAHDARRVSSWHGDRRSLGLNGFLPAVQHAMDSIQRTGSPRSETSCATAPGALCQPPGACDPLWLPDDLLGYRCCPCPLRCLQRRRFVTAFRVKWTPGPPRPGQCSDRLAYVLPVAATDRPASHGRPPGSPRNLQERTARLPARCVEAIRKRNG